MTDDVIDNTGCVIVISVGNFSFYPLSIIQIESYHLTYTFIYVHQEVFKLYLSF